ncbi:MAG: hypothetical protein M1826_001269 [Phylliscum demangeonii]|nr:MAG: hypothetical protein M1826_001269 [Phylliscum demangeonii]
MEALAHALLSIDEASSDDLQARFECLRLEGALLDVAHEFLMTPEEERAFRQRKEAYIKKLEDELKAMKAIKDENAALQRENVCLRDYIIHLQERALETGTQVPPMPTSIAMGQPPTTSPTMASDEIPSLVPPTAGMVPEQAHAAVADMGGSRAAAPLQQARSQAHGFASPATSAHLAHGHQTGMVGYGASQRLQSAGQGSPVDPRDIDPNLTRATADHNHHPGRNASRSMLDPPPVTLAERAEIMRWRGGMGSGPGTGTGNGEGSGTGSGTGPGTGAGTNGNGPTL